MDNKIDTLIIHLRLPKSYAAGEGQNTVYSILQHECTAIIDEVFTSLCPQHHVLYFDAVTLDLGNIPLHAITTQLRKVLIDHFKDKIQYLVSSPPSTTNHTHLVSMQDHEEQLFIFFMQNGFFPWNTSEKVRRNPDYFFRRVIGNGSGKWDTVILSKRHNQHFISRMIRQLSEGNFRLLLSTLFTDTKLLHLLWYTEQQCGKNLSITKKRDVREFFYKSLFAYACERNFTINIHVISAVHTETINYMYKKGFNRVKNRLMQKTVQQCEYDNDKDSTCSTGYTCINQLPRHDSLFETSLSRISAIDRYQTVSGISSVQSSTSAETISTDALQKDTKEHDISSSLSILINALTSHSSDQLYEAWETCQESFPLDIITAITQYTPIQKLLHTIVVMFSNRQYRELVEQQEPVYASFVFRFLDNLDRQRFYRYIPGFTFHQFYTQVKEIILNYIFCQKGVSFKPSMFVRTFIEQTAAQYRISYTTIGHFLLNKDQIHLPTVLYNEIQNCLSVMCYSSRILTQRSTDRIFSRSRAIHTDRAVTGADAAAARQEEGITDQQRSRYPVATRWDGSMYETTSSTRIDIHTLGASLLNNKFSDFILAMTFLTDNTVSDAPTLIVELCQDQKYREHLAWKVPDEVITVILGILEPRECIFLKKIIHVSKTVVVQKKPFFTSSHVFRAETILCILTYLTVNRGSAFNKKSFMKHYLAEISHHYNVTVRETVTMILSFVNSEMHRNSRYHDLMVLLQELYLHDCARQNPAIPSREIQTNTHAVSFIIQCQNNIRNTAQLIHTLSEKSVDTVITFLRYNEVVFIQEILDTYPAIRSCTAKSISMIEFKKSILIAVVPFYSIHTNRITDHCKAYLHWLRICASLFRVVYIELVHIVYYFHKRKNAVNTLSHAVLASCILKKKKQYTDTTYQSPGTGKIRQYDIFTALYYYLINGIPISHYSPVTNDSSFIHYFQKLLAISKKETITCIREIAQTRGLTEILAQKHSAHFLKNVLSILIRTVKGIDQPFLFDSILSHMPGIPSQKRYYASLCEMAVTDATIDIEKALLYASSYHSTYNVQHTIISSNRMLEEWLRWFISHPHIHKRYNISLYELVTSGTMVKPVVVGTALRSIFGDTMLFKNFCTHADIKTVLLCLCSINSAGTHREKNSALNILLPLCGKMPTQVRMTFLQLLYRSIINRKQLTFFFTQCMNIIPRHYVKDLFIHAKKKILRRIFFPADTDSQFESKSNVNSIHIEYIIEQLAMKPETVNRTDLLSVLFNESDLFFLLLKKSPHNKRCIAHLVGCVTENQILSLIAHYIPRHFHEILECLHCLKEFTDYVRITKNRSWSYKSILTAAVTYCLISRWKIFDITDFFSHLLISVSAHTDHTIENYVPLVSDFFINANNSYTETTKRALFFAFDTISHNVRHEHNLQPPSEKYYSPQTAYIPDTPHHVSSPLLFPTDSIDIKNCGLVLLAPFLPRLFTSLHFLAEKSAFIDNDAMQQAVYLLHYLVFESYDTVESELSLNKLLCGAALRVPLNRDISLSDHHKHTANEMLKAAVRHWSKLGQTTIDGFRGSFLIRNATLTAHSDTFTLDAEEKAYDVLLDYIPWGFKLIKFAWMEKPIYVNWRNR